MHIRTPLELGLVIRQQRRQLGLSQTDLASRVGVGRQWIVAIEQGKARAELGLAMRTLAALDLTLAVEGGGDATMRQGGDATMRQGGDATMRQGGDATMRRQGGDATMNSMTLIDIDAVIDAAKGRRP